MNNVSLNRRFIEADDEDEQEVCRLIFKAYYKIVFGVVDRVFRGHPDPAVDADDIANETFMKAFKERKDIQKPEKLLEWLIRAAKNLMIDKMRRLRTRTRRVPTEAVGHDLELESEVSFASTIAETDTEQYEANRYLVARLLRLLKEKDREIVAFILDGFTPKEIAAMTNSTPGAVQKRWERLKIWMVPILLHLEALIDCLPEENDRKIMERYLDGQPLSEIAKAIGISCSAIEKRVKRVIARWKKAVRENPTDPVSAMANDRDND